MFSLGTHPLIMLLIMITFSNFEFSLNANLLTESHEHLTKSQINLSKKKKKSFILIQEWVKGFSEINKVTKNHARIDNHKPNKHRDNMLLQALQ